MRFDRPGTFGKLKAMLAKFECFLDDISCCFIEQDVKLWMSRLTLPFTIVTKDGPTVMATDAAVKDNFDCYLKACEIMQLDLIDRTIVALEDCQDGTWLGTFKTRLLSRQILATAPYTSTALLTLQNSRFRMSSMLNGRGHTDWTHKIDR